MFASLPFTLSHQCAGQRDQLLAIIDSIFQRVEAANQEGGNPQVVIVQQRFGDLFRGADQRRGIALRAEQASDARPQALVQS
ncbi:Uncharacterized protein AC513_2069 [Pseudomonas savastanoi pv. phaseolicola]|nr:Uncharacterized protein AC513_2069 [Pseudomonas savastanoi pv. phaseolicola]